MKKFIILACLVLVHVQAMEYKVLFENERSLVSRVIIGPWEEVGLHRDALPQIVIGVQGGVVTRLETDGREVEVPFPTGKAVYRSVDPEDQFHKSVNTSDKPIELIIVEFKDLHHTSG